MSMFLVFPQPPVLSLLAINSAYMCTIQYWCKECDTLQFVKAKKKNMCGSGYPTYPRFVPPTLNIFLQRLKLEENSRTK